MKNTEIGCGPHVAPARALEFTQSTPQEKGNDAVGKARRGFWRSPRIRLQILIRKLIQRSGPRSSSGWIQCSYTPGSETWTSTPRHRAQPAAIRGQAILALAAMLAHVGKVPEAIVDRRKPRDRS